MNSGLNWEGQILYDKAKKKVEEILASPPKNPLPDDVIAKLEEIMRKADDDPHLSRNILEFF